MMIKNLDGAGQGRYIALNAGLNLYDNINKYHGLRYCLEKVCLQISSLFRPALLLSASGNIKELTHIEKMFGPIESGFLLDTSWYKDTFFIGTLKIRDSHVFVKYFKEGELSHIEVINHAKIFNVYKDSYRFSEILYSDDVCIIQTLIPNKGQQCDVQYMFESAVLANKKMYHFSSKTKALSTLTFEVINKFSDIKKTLNLSADFETVLNDLLTSVSELDLLYCHGDYTTWNTVIDEHGDRYLVDFECCEDKVLYTDIFHLLTQKSCLLNEPVQLEKLINKISTALVIPNEKVALYYIGYILEQLVSHFSEWNSGKQHAQLANLIKNKSNLLCETYDYLEDK